MRKFRKTVMRCAQEVEFENIRKKGKTVVPLAVSQDRKTLYCVYGKVYSGREQPIQVLAAAEIKSIKPQYSFILQSV